jgi:hypothetical protein
MSGSSALLASLAFNRRHNFSSTLAARLGQDEAIYRRVFSIPMARRLSVEQEELRWEDAGHFTPE